MIGELSRIAIHSINTHPIAIAVSADQAYFQIVRRNFSNRALIYLSHHPLDARRAKKNVGPCFYDRELCDCPPLRTARFAVIM